MKILLTFIAVLFVGCGNSYETRLKSKVQKLEESKIELEERLKLIESIKTKPKEQDEAKKVRENIAQNYRFIEQINAEISKQHAKGVSGKIYTCGTNKLYFREDGKLEVNDKFVMDWISNPPRVAFSYTGIGQETLIQHNSLGEEYCIREFYLVEKPKVGLLVKTKTKIGGANEFLQRVDLLEKDFIFCPLIEEK